MTANDECSVNCRDRIYHFTSHRSLFTFRSLPHRGRFLAFAGAQVIELGAAGAAFFFHFHFGNSRRMQREHALDSFAVGNTPNGESLVQTATFSANDNTGENLNAFFVAFDHPSMDADGVAYAKCWRLSFELVFLDGVDDAVHGSSFSRALNLRGCAANASVVIP